MAPSEASVSSWNCKQVAGWLRAEGFGEYVQLLCTQHRLDGTSLLALTEADLRGPPLGLAVLGDIKRLALALRRLQRQNQARLEELGLDPAATDELSGRGRTARGTWASEWSCTNGAAYRCHRGDRSCDGVSEFCLGRPAHRSDGPLCHAHANGRSRQHMTGRLDPELWKTVMSTVYVMFVFGFTSFVMVIVHERVPDMRTYPPLPDIFLDRYVRVCVCVCVRACVCVFAHVLACA